MRVGTTAAFCLLVLLFFGSIAQAQEPEQIADSQEESLPSAFSGEVGIRNVWVSDPSTEEEDEISASGLVLRGRLQYSPRPSGFSAAVASAYYDYRDDARADRWSNDLRAQYESRLGRRVRLTTIGRYGSNLFFLEADQGDQAEISGRFEYRLDNRQRIRAAAGYRHRWYDDAGETSAEAPFAGVEYRYRWAGWHTLDLDARQEWIDAEVERRSYDRTTFVGTYTRPLTENTRVRFLTTFRWWEFSARPVGGDENRSDTSIAPELQVIHDFRNGWRLAGQYRFSSQSSNDPRFDEERSRASGTVSYRF